MGLFDRFTKSLDDEVNEALEKVRGMNLGIRDLDASIDDKVVTLTGAADSKEAKFQAMEVFSSLVTKARNTLNTIRIEEPATAPAPEPDAPAAPAPEVTPAERFHEVVSGDTLGAIAQTYYGKASLYMKIFEANRDTLDDPNLIKVGQKLRIPE